MGSGFITLTLAPILFGPLSVQFSSNPFGTDLKFGVFDIFFSDSMYFFVVDSSLKNCLIKKKFSIGLNELKVEECRTSETTMATQRKSTKNLDFLTI
jgi:hypothetical protein